MRNRIRGVLGIVWLATAFSPAAADEAAPSFARDLHPFLKQHCYACHGPEEQEARVRFDQIEGYDVEQQQLWAKVHEMLSTGAMPPEDRPQPAEAEKNAVLAWIEKQAAEADRALGSGSLRRLNRRELAAALKDLTGLSVNYADALPGDGTVAGFDTGAAGLQDAADSVAQVMRVTRRAVDAVRFVGPATGKTLALDLREAMDARRAFDAWKDDGAVVKGSGLTREGTGLLIEPRWVGERGSLEIVLPPPEDRRGVLRLKLVVAAVKSRAEIPDPHLWVEVGAKDIDFRPIIASPAEPQELLYEIQLDDLAIETSGLRIALSNKVEVPYAVEGFANDDRSKAEDNVPEGVFRPAFDRKKLPPEEQPVPFVVLQQIEIDPDHVAPWPPAEWEADVGEIGDDHETAAQLLKLWMERAWRRPVTAAEQQRFLTLYERLRNEGAVFDDALRATFQSVLMSGPFRYLSSPADPDDAIAQHALASRLSFMLWGAPPDGELRRLAAERRLRDPAVLDAQVDRLLDDPRSDAFVRPFVTQWLELDQPITIAMDHIQKQDFRFGRYLKESMREETIAYVARVLAENRPVEDLISSDWTMMNESLALHYGYQGVKGGELREVKLRDGDPRGGGILGHAGIQSMLCWMGENWVIYRGAWTLRHILDDPPPPPPLEVPELIPSDGANRGKTFKELLQQHQEDSRCAVCHKSIDPMGFAFQNFDLSGRWREVEYERYERNELDGKIEWRGVGQTRPVDAVGRLPRGEEFSSFAECKERMIEHYLPDIAGGLLKNFAIYATGRTPSVQDAAELKRILEAHAPRGYPLRDLLKAVVRSDAFLKN